MADKVIFLTTPATVGATATSVSTSNTFPNRITVGALASGTIAIGQVVIGCEANSFNNAIDAGTTIVSQFSGTPGGAGVYIVSTSQTDVNVTYPLVYFMMPQAWTVPADFSPVNTIEVLAGGAQGGPGPGDGGGGATYAKIINLALTPGNVIGYVVAPGVSGVSVTGNQFRQGYDGAFGLSNAGPAVAAKGGISGAPGNSAQNPAWSTGTTIHIGGHTTTGGAGLGGGGGGGAAGPNGAGGAGGNPGGTAGGGGGGADGGTDASGGTGGNSFAGVLGGTAANPGNPGASGSGAGGGISNSAGGSGSMEPLIWISNPGSVAAGPGSGGGGGAYTGAFAGGDAGGYGGGGGGGGYNGGAGGAGTPGIIVITYTPMAPTNYTPGTGSIELTGHAPSLENVANTFFPGTGHIRLTGQTPRFGEVALFDASATVISQYANSPAILQMVQNFANWIAPGQLLGDFYNLIWNIDSAVGYGLDVWGRIVGVGRVLHVATDAVYFGFQEASAGDHVTGFNQAPFYDGQSVTANFSLSDSAYRQLILAKAAANICNGSIPAINQVLIDIFGSSGNAYVVDNEDMTMVYHFTFPLDPVQEAIVNNSGVLPKPAGVLATVFSP